MRKVKTNLKCLVGDCESSVASGCSLHKFPKIPEVERKWIENLGFTESFASIPKRRRVICRRHFTPDCVNLKKLNASAVPTLFLDNGTAEVPHQNVLRKAITRRCSIRNCNTVEPEPLHLFPPDPERRAKWLEICGFRRHRRKYLLCRRHFRPSFLLPKKLSKHAFPEFHLGLEHVDPLQASDDSPSEDEDEETKKQVDSGMSCSPETKLDEEVEDDDQEEIEDDQEENEDEQEEIEDDQEVVEDDQEVVEDD
ncbi:hypothetical protein KR222_011788, partial [Zaprionus bogoriensis]